MPMEVERHELRKLLGGAHPISPCKNCRNLSLHPKASAACLKPKYQFSLRGNIKDRRDLRGGGVDFETPPYGLKHFVHSQYRP